ncbi:MAG: hypothetical protein ABSG19_03950 [Candidatus Aminicenantales bacterium]
MMGTRWKKALLFSVLIASLLGLYRNFGVSLYAFWPLILLDSVLRLPGDALLRIPGPRVSVAAYEVLGGLFQVGVVLVLWWIVEKLRAQRRLRRVQRQVPQPPPQDQAPQINVARARKKRLATLGCVVLGLLILNGRCGRGLVSMLNFFTGVQGYPLHVTTEVSVGNPQKTTSERLGEATKKPSVHRPPMLVLFEDDGQLRSFEHTAKSIWEVISQEGSLSYSVTESGDLKASSQDMLAVMGLSGKESPKGETADSVARRRGIIRGGASPALILKNLDILIAQAGGGWRREQAGGYVAALGKARHQEVPFTITNLSLSPCLIQAENLEESCRFLRDLTGVPMIVEAQPQPAEGQEQAGAPPDIVPVQFSFDGDASIAEFMGKLARTRRLRTEVRENRIIIRDLGSGEIESRVRELFDAFRSRKFSSWPDPTLKSFPRNSAPFIVAYLDDQDKDVIGYAVDALGEVGPEPALDDLRRLLKTGRTKNGLVLSESTMEEITAVLMKAGDPAAMEYIRRSGKIGREDVGDWLKRTVDVKPTVEAVDIQDLLLAKYRIRSPLVRPGKIRFKRLPSGVSRDEAAAMERRALDILNTFERMDWDEDANANLDFSPDGAAAKYRIELSHYWGPLAAGGTDYTVEFVKVNGRWLATAIKRGWGWMS